MYGIHMRNMNMYPYIHAHIPTGREAGRAAKARKLAQRSQRSPGGMGSARARGELGRRDGLVPVPFESAGVVEALGGAGKDARGAAGAGGAEAGGAGAGGRGPRAATGLDTSVTGVDETPRLRQGSSRALTGVAGGSEGGTVADTDAPRSACSRTRGGGAGGGVGRGAGGGGGGGAGAGLSTYSSTSRARLDEERREKRGARAREGGGQGPVGVDKMKYGSVANRYQCVP